MTTKKRNEIKYIMFENLRSVRRFQRDRLKLAPSWSSRHLLTKSHTHLPGSFTRSTRRIPVKIDARISLEYFNNLKRRDNLLLQPRGKTKVFFVNLNPLCHSVFLKLNSLIIIQNTIIFLDFHDFPTLEILKISALSTISCNMKEKIRHIFHPTTSNWCFKK